MMQAHLRQLYERARRFWHEHLLLSALLVALIWHLLFLALVSFEPARPHFPSQEGLMISFEPTKLLGPAQQTWNLVTERPVSELPTLLPIEKETIFSARYVQNVLHKQIQLLDRLIHGMEDAATGPKIEQLPGFSFRILSGGHPSLFTAALPEDELNKRLSLLPKDVQIVCHVLRMGSPPVLAWSIPEQVKLPAHHWQPLLNLVIPALFVEAPDPQGVERAEMVLYFSPSKERL